MKFFKHWILLLAIGFPFVFIAKARAVVTIYDKTNFSGQKLVITEDMASLGNMNKKMQSFEISSGSQVKFYDQENFQGRSYLVTSSNKDPRTYRNTIQSLQIIKRGKAIVEKESRFDIWSNKIKDKVIDFTEDKAPPKPKPVVKAPNIEPKPIVVMPPPAPPPVTANTTDLFGKKDKEATKTGKKDIAVVIYDKNNMKGLSYNITKNTSSLGTFNDKMSSYIVSECYQVEFFDEENYEGDSWKAPFPLPSHGAAEGYLDDKISSIKITKKPKFFGTECISEEVK